MTLIIFIVFIALIVKLYSIQISNNEFYKLIADRQQNKPQSVKAERGLITDMNGEVLSFTRDNISFFADTRMMNDKKVDSIASVFSDIFGKNKSYYKNIIGQGVKNVCLEKKVSMDKALKLKKVVIEGLFYEEDFSRVYPYGSLASHILGYVDTKMKGTDGIEKIYDNTLTGTDGFYVFERDVLGRIVSISENQSRAPIPGNNITLTINKTYQQILEEELSKGLAKYEGESAVGIIMNPNTGEIYALANSPDYDPANFEIFSNDVRRNRILTDTFEPGSTMKSISLSILLDQHLAKSDELIDTENGTFYYKSAKISDTHPHSNLTVREILELSSNVGMAKLSLRIPDDVFYKYLRDFGFGNPTSIDLPGETSGFLKKPNNFSALTKPFLSFGYEISATPLQMIASYSALINGGVLYQPYILKSVKNYLGNIIGENKPKKIRNVIDKETSDLIRDMMVGVVEQGTGKTAQLENVMVGGKTGTAQQLVDNSYSNRKHNSSFIGFFPAQNPKIICMILVNAPKIGKYGGLVAAPIFQQVAKRIIETDLSIVPEKRKIERKENIVDQFIAEMKTAPVSNGKNYLNVSNKNKNGISKRNFFREARTTMPNLVNGSMRDAVAQLNELGLEYKISGTGKVIEQSIEPGSSIAAGDTCMIVCSPSRKTNSMRVN
ncbi:MAG: penicillin-binding protein [Melioribacteraceae bacterium]|nr:penicillin-binding protein [Melioribacteraceae bacterium]